MTSIEINNKSYVVGTISPDIEIDYDYSLTTLDGRLHQKVKGVRTNYSISFPNFDNGDFYELLKLFLLGEKVSLTVPKNATETYTSEYYPEVSGYNAKGVLNNGHFYHNGLKVNFYKVGYDE